MDGLLKSWIAILVIILIQDKNHMKRFLRPADMKQQMTFSGNHQLFCTKLCINQQLMFLLLVPHFTFINI